MSDFGDLPHQFACYGGHLHGDGSGSAWKPQRVSATIQYVVAEQGEAMSAFESNEC